MKPGTFTQNYLHIVFAVKYRRAALTKDIRPRVFEYISGIVTSLKHKSYIVNGVADHVHILLGLDPSVSISETVYHIKRGSSLFINKEGLCKDRFAWQEGYSSFTYGRSQLDRIYKYIENQEQHHEKSTFKKEYVQFLKKYDVEYNDRFLFNFWDDDQ